MSHQFLLDKNLWIGEGNISLNMVEEDLTFYTKWQFSPKDEIGKISAIQEIQINGISENMKNELVFYDFTTNKFLVEMENVNIGKITGSGIYDEKLISWEFRNTDLNFEGFETYYLQEDGSYLMHAEYVTSDQFRTQIEGRVWLPPLTKE